MVRSSIRTIGTHSPMRAGSKFAPEFARLVRTHHCANLGNPQVKKC